MSDQLPVILSLTLTLSVLTFFTMIGDPLSHLWGTNLNHNADEARGMLGIMLDTALLMGAMLLLVRQWKLAPGALTLILGLNAVAVGFLVAHPYPTVFVLARVLAGLIADGLLLWLKPSVQQPTAWRAFAILVPVVIYGLYFLAAQFAGGIGWTTHLWAGSIVIAGAIGFLLSLLVAPPPAAPPTAAPAASTT